MKYKTFDEIASEMLSNKKFLKLNDESHHGITRMQHSMRVARNVYKYAIKFNLDYISATRAAIVHDFFTNEEFGNNLGLIQGVIHPDISLENARGEFPLNEKEANMIESHMFPLSTVVPKSKEAWLLTAVDKIIAIYEYASNKFSPSRIRKTVSYASTYALIVVFNYLISGK